MSTSQPEKRPLLGEQHHSGYGDDHSINTKQEHGHVELSEGRQRTTGSIQIGLLILKAYLGSGILGLPYGFVQSGLVAGTIIMILVAIMTIHTMSMLVKAKQELVARQIPVVTFGNIMGHLYGKWGQILVDILLVFTQAGFCCVYVVFLGQNVLPYLPWNINWRYVSLMWFPIFVGLSWLRSLKKVAPLSIFANVNILFGIGVAYTVSAIMLVRQHDAGTVFDNVTVWVNWANIPTMFGIAIYAFEGIGLVLPCETAIKNPAKFPRVLVLCLTIASINYTLFGSVCYSAFGHNTESEFTVNLDQFAAANGHVWYYLIKAITICLIIGIIALYPLQLFPVTDICEEHIFKNVSTEERKTWGFYWKQNAFRTSVVVGTMIIGLSAGPNIGLLIGLVGALGSSALQFLFPALIHMKLFRHTTNKAHLALDVFYIFLGLAGGVIGTIQIVMKIIDVYKNEI
jgi:proton-coupled amino acid transporter